VSLRIAIARTDRNFRSAIPGKYANTTCRSSYNGSKPMPATTSWCRRAQVSYDKHAETCARIFDLFALNWLPHARQCAVMGTAHRMNPKNLLVIVVIACSLCRMPLALQQLRQWGHGLVSGRQARVGPEHSTHSNDTMPVILRKSFDIT